MSYESTFQQFVKDRGLDKGGSDQNMNNKSSSKLEPIKEDSEKLVEDEEFFDVEYNKSLENKQQKREESKSPVDIFSTQSSDGDLVTFQDMPKPSGQSLEIIYHEPVYALPILTNPKYQHLSVLERARLLSDYFTKLRQAETQIARRLLNKAPLPKPILASSKCVSSLLKSDPQDEQEDEKNCGYDFLEDAVQEVQTQKFYVSRSGRQVKRKVYTEDSDRDSDPDFQVTGQKKAKAEVDWGTKLTLESPLVSDEEKGGKNQAKARKDTPKRTSATKKLGVGRTLTMMSLAANKTEKQMEKEREMEEFTKGLSGAAEEEEGGGSPVRSGVDENEENFIRKRVTPPARKRPALRKQSKQEDWDKIEVDNRPVSPIIQRYLRLNISAEKNNSKENQAGTSQSNKNQDCPICGKNFPQSEIENHASTCGDENEDPAPPQRPNPKEVKCELCDKMFPSDKTFEDHTKVCMASFITDK